MLINRCKWDSKDKVTGEFACVDPKSNKFSMLKSYACSNMQIGCNRWEPYNPISLICFEDVLPFFAIRLLAKII